MLPDGTRGVLRPGKAFLVCFNNNTAVTQWTGKCINSIYKQFRRYCFIKPLASGSKSDSPFIDKTYVKDIQALFRALIIVQTCRSNIS